MRIRPRLVTIPSADLRFAEYARLTLDALPGDLPTPRAVTDFQRRLQERYPGAVVRPRDQLAEVGEPDEVVWYATNRAYGTRIAAAVEIAAPRDVVFAVYTERVPEWQTAARFRLRHRTTALAGSEWTASWPLLGTNVRIDGVFRVVEADPPHSVRFEASGMGIRVWYVTAFTVSPAGTTVRVIGDYDLPVGILPPIVDRHFIERAIQQQIDAAHASLAELCVRVAREMGARTDAVASGPVPAPGTDG